MSAGNDIYEHGFSTAVASYNGDMFAVERLEIDGLSHSPFFHTGDTLLYINYFLHILF